MNQPLSPFCIYTIRHHRDLDEAYRSGGNGQFTENTMWSTGQRLFLEAKKNGQRMPVIFASADIGTDRLIYYAMLRDVEINESGSTTTYEFASLQQIASHHPLSSLTLRSTNRPLSDNFIRPYAICLTPSFIE
jgi:hypothetical protein